MTAFVPGAAATGEPSPDDPCIAVAGDDILLRERELPRLRDLAGTGDICALGQLDGRPLWAVAVPTPSATPGLSRLTWPEVAARLEPALVRIVARGLHTITWRDRNRWCGRCRGPLEDLPWHLGRRCPVCEINTFVSSQPVVIVAVLRDGPAGPEILLVRHTYRDTVSWLLVGGWVDPGETLEQAAVREAGEEVGLAVTDLRYWGDEAWGLDGPGILATLFTARPVDPTAEPTPDLHELAEARFFPLDALPEPRAPGHHISGQFLDSLTSS